MTDKKHDANRDPITGTPGAHPVGTGVGAALGGVAAGAAAGTVAAGPVGTVVGAAVGAVAGGLAGKAVGERVNPTVEDAHWRENYTNEPYHKQAHGYEDYEPAYRTGYEARARHADSTFDEVEDDLRLDYEKRKGNSRLGWDDAKPATRAAWDRVDRAAPGESNVSDR